MRLRNKLSVKGVAAITRVGVHGDGGGLYLKVRENTSRAWIFIYTLNGKRREMGLGSDLDVSLGRAREMAAAARALVFDGNDPIEMRKADRAPAKPVQTFGEFAMSWLDGVEEGFKNAKHRQQWRNTLKTYAAPLFDQAIPDIDASAIAAVLQPIWLTKAETAGRVRGRIEKVLDAAKVGGLRTGDNPARFRGNLDHLLAKRGKVPVKHHAALPFKNIAAFMAELRQRPAVTARALEFVVLTAARSGEVRGMTWAEVDEAERLWTVPAARMKAGAEHQVPLSDAALVALRAVRPAEPHPAALAFPSTKRGPLSDMAFGQLLRRMGRGDVTAHGFRSTFRDWAGEATQFGREEIEMALAHTIVSATERAYRRDRALPKRRELMAAWADYCAGREAGSEI